MPPSPLLEGEECWWRWKAPPCWVGLMLGRCIREGKSLWDAQLHPCKNSFALDFREYITLTCREGKLLHRKAVILHDEKALPWTGQWEAQGASQGPVQLPHPLDDLLVGEVGSRAAFIFMNCETVTMAVTSFANVSLPSPDANVCIPVRILCYDFGFQISRPSVLCKSTLSISTIRFPSSKYQM